MTKLWQCINYIVPGPDCDTFGDQITAWRDARPQPTQAQLDAALTAVQAQLVVPATLQSNADDALANLRAYRDLASPTNTQTVAAVKLLCRVAIILIRLQLSKYDAAD